MAEKKEENKKEEKEEEKSLDPKYLKGLQYRYSESRTVEEEGRKVRKFMAKSRPLRVDDVLDWSDKGGHVVIVTADGRKYRVDK